MKIFHTADWHLGHQLHGHERTREHQYFLDTLFALLEQHRPDALLVAGDLFDSGNPSAAAWQQLYRFLKRLRDELPQIDVILIGGNHDSAAKLDAPHELLRLFELHLIGAISRDGAGNLEVDRLLLPITNATGETVAWCAAIPFLRSSDLRPKQLAEGQDRLVQGVREIYAEVLAEGRARAGSLPLIAMGHAYLVRGQLSELSERKVLGGNQHALPLDIFDGADYVALGHLHLAQALNERVHYSGSPLPLSLSESEYNHQLLEVTLEPGELPQVKRHGLPHRVPMIRTPAGTIDEVLQQLQALPINESEAELAPFLEVTIELPKPEARIRERIMAAIAGKGLRLARIVTHYPSEISSPTQLAPLEELDAETIFQLCYQRQHQGEPPEPLLAAFHEICQQLEEGER